MRSAAWMPPITMTVATVQINAITQPLLFSCCAADHIAPWTVKPTKKATVKNSQSNTEKSDIAVLHSDAGRCASKTLNPTPGYPQMGGGMTEKPPAPNPPLRCTKTHPMSVKPAGCALPNN